MSGGETTSGGYHALDLHIDALELGLSEVLAVVLVHHHARWALRCF
jgi:hypothetical protein